MLGYLSDILAGIEDLPTLVMAGVYDVLNGLFAALAAFITILFNALHTVAPMPNLPSLTGQWLGWLNWIFPLGQIADAAASLIGMYVGWLALKWAFQLLKLGGEGV